MVNFARIGCTVSYFLYDFRKKRCNISYSDSFIMGDDNCTHSQPKSLQSARRGLAENPKRPCEVERPARLAQDEDRVSRLVTKTCGKAVRFERASGEAGTGSSIGSKGSHGPAPGTSESKKSEVVMAARQSATTSAQARQSGLACNALGVGAGLRRALTGMMWFESQR